MRQGSGGDRLQCCSCYLSMRTETCYVRGGEHMVSFHPCRVPISAEFSADPSSQSRKNWHNVYCLEGSEIKTKTPMVPLNK